MEHAPEIGCTTETCIQESYGLVKVCRLEICSQLMDSVLEDCMSVMEHTLVMGMMATDKQLESYKKEIYILEICTLGMGCN